MRGPKPSALAHAAGHEAPDQDLAVKPQRPNHRASHPVRFGDQGVVGNIDPDILKADSIVAVLDSQSTSLTAKPSANEQHSPLPDASLLNHSSSSGWPGSWASAGEQSSRRIRTIRITTDSLLSKAYASGQRHHFS